MLESSTFGEYERAIINYDWSKWKDKTDNFSQFSSITSQKIYGNHLNSSECQISIVIMTYRRPDTLELAVNSALQQNFEQPYEVIVVDDSGDQELLWKPTDALMKTMCCQYENLVYYRNLRNLGQQANWNRAIELCRTKWVAFLHDDGLLNSDYLKTVDQAIRSVEHTKLAAVGILNQTIDSPPSFISRIQNRVLRRAGDKLIPFRLSDQFKLQFPQAPGLFVSREKYLESGGMDPVFFDNGLVAKLTYWYDCALLPKVLYQNSNSEDAMSLRSDVLNGFVLISYKLCEAIGRTLGYKGSKVRRIASLAAIRGENVAKNYIDSVYYEAKQALGLQGLYQWGGTRVIVAILTKFAWLRLLFRKRI
jgi:glycosyltransferase involved in cell wall biosynthesis